MEPNLEKSSTFQANVPVQFCIGFEIYIRIYVRICIYMQVAITNIDNSGVQSEESSSDKEFCLSFFCIELVFFMCCIFDRLKRSSP